MATSRTFKWPTYLSICADILFGECRSNDCNREVDTVLYDSIEGPHDALLFLWSRLPPEEAIYIATHLSIACKPLRMAAAEPDFVRPVPDSMDGTSTGGAVLPPGCPLLTGIGVLTVVAADKKSGVIVGLTFLGKVQGWAEFEVHVHFEDGPRWHVWTLPAPRTLVSFDAVLCGLGEDGALQGSLRRIFSIQPAPQALLQALNVGSTPSADRATKLKELRARGLRQKAQVGTEMVVPESVADAINSTPVKLDTSQPVNPPIPTKPTRSAGIQGPPSSPTPAQGARKRGRAE